MQEYAIQRSSRKCYRNNRPLEPGERYISAIVQKGSELVRRDFGLDAWSGPDADTVGWWKTSIPSKKTTGKTLAPPRVLVDTLEALLDTAGQESLAYLLALLLVRRRVLIEVESFEAAMQESDLDEPTHMSLRFAADDRVLDVPIVPADREQSSVLQAKLAELLYAEE
ncbi:hypothetical protein VN12_13595 [Pirellula sp. SH-Sr6A]|nr:hypothetical protein VN12_13595 [Pirellula sp. SH-Sr6A]